MAVASQLLDDLRLVGGQHVGDLPREAKTLADGISHRRVVARQHDGVADTHAVERFNNLPAFRPDTVLIGDEAGKLAIDGDIKAGAAALIDGSAVRASVLDLDVALAKKAFVANMHVVAVDAPIDSEPGPVQGFITWRRLHVHLRLFSRSASATGWCRWVSAATASTSR